MRFAPGCDESDERSRGTQDPRIDAARPRFSCEVNKQIVRISSEWKLQDPIVVYCECGRHECQEEVELTLAECQAVRGRPTLFVLKPGHQSPELERVVEAHDGYVLTAAITGESAEPVEVGLRSSAESRKLGSLAERHGLRLSFHPERPAALHARVSVSVPRALGQRDADEAVASLVDWIV